MSPGAEPSQPEFGLPEAARRAIAHVARLAEGEPLGPELRVTLHFHPDRLTSEGQPILAAMAADGRYRSQFETRTSNGGLTAWPGGDRWRWESRIFGAAYDGAPAALRPVYGSLNYRGRAAGGSPRFGSAWFRLRSQTLARTTFCYPDSYLEPEQFGVAGTAAALATLAGAGAGQADPLDDYVEAQVHGPVQPATDAEALVLDPCYRGTGVERDAAALGCPVEWHGGFALAPGELRAHPDYRGLRYVALGAELAAGGLLTPRVIGDAARTGHYDQQDLKRVWHCLARFGPPTG